MTLMKLSPHNLLEDAKRMFYLQHSRFDQIANKIKEIGATYAHHVC